MNALVTLEQASDHLRRDTEDDNEDLQLKIYAALEIVLDYLKDAADRFLDSSGNVIVDSNDDPVVPYRVKVATLLMVSELYKNREGFFEGDAPAQYGYGYIPRSVMTMLYSMRKPTVA